MEEKRELERRAVLQNIRYSVTVLDFRDLRRLSLKGNIVDISDVGMGIKTDFPLEPGHVLTFNDNIGRRAGIVEWSSRVQDNGYRVGIRFV